MYKGNGIMMIRIFFCGVIQLMVLEYYKMLIIIKLGVFGYVYRLMIGFRVVILC